MIPPARIAITPLFVLACVLTLACAGAQDSAQDGAQDAGRPKHAAAEHVCLDQKERRIESESGTLIRLAAAMHAARSRMPGAVVRARLCHGSAGLVYVLTVLARDGKVARLTVDATSGTVVGER
jgi:uncharacterized membrane protein YkoI